MGAARFATHTTALIEMTEADLLQLGVKLMGHRKMFMRELRALCE